MFRVVYKEGPVETVYFVGAASPRDARRLVAEHVGERVDAIGGGLLNEKASMSATPHDEVVKLYSFNVQTGEMT